MYHQTSKSREALLGCKQQIKARQWRITCIPQDDIFANHQLWVKGNYDMRKKALRNKANINEYFTRGHVYSQKQQQKKAIDSYKKALEIDKKDGFIFDAWANGKAEIYSPSEWDKGSTLGQLARDYSDMIDTATSFWKKALSD